MKSYLSVRGILQTLEFHLVSAHDSFTESANQFLSKRELSVIGDGSLVTFRMVLAFISALVGALLTFPGVRVAKCHLDSLLIARDRPLLQMIMYADLLFPVFILSLWVPPISRTPLLGNQLILCISENRFPSLPILCFVCKSYYVLSLHYIVCSLVC